MQKYRAERLCNQSINFKLKQSLVDATYNCEESEGRMKASAISIVSGACLAVCGCSTSGTSGASGEVDLDAVNALIALFTTEDPGDPTTATALGATVPAVATYAVLDEDTIEVSWNNGPLSGKTRTFVSDAPGPFVLDDPDEEGMLTVWRSTEYSLAASATVIGNDSTSGALGLAHAGIAPTDIPTSGTLTYTAEEGALVQIVQFAGPSLCSSPAGGCVGDVNIAANFQTGAVNGTFSNFTGGISDVGFAGTMNSGNALYSSTALTYGGAAANGKLLGGFYGPGAVDTAGVFDMTSSGTRLLGQYAASSAAPPSSGRRMSVSGVVKVVALALLLALVATPRVSAEEPDPFAVVVRLVAEGQYDAARQYAAGYGKTPRAKSVNVAFVDALILKHQGRLVEAAAAMRALLAVSPQFDMVRTELAHTLYLMGDYEAAQHHFELLSAASRFPASRSLYDRFLVDIRRKRPWTLNAFVNIAPSTNINNGLNSGVVEIGGIEFRGATEKESGVGLGYGVDGSYRFDLAQRFDLTLGGSATGTAYSNHDYDVLTGQAFAELGLDAAPWRFGIAATGERVLSGWEGYSWGLGPQFSVRRDFGRAGTLLAVAGWRALVHDRNPEFDGAEARLSLKYRYAVNPATEIAVGASYTHVTAEVAFNGYDSTRPVAEIYREFAGGFIVDARVAYELRRYAADFPLLDHPREDGRLELALGVTHRRLSAHGFAPRLEYVYRRNDSNIELFRTDSHGLNLTFTRRY